MVMWGIVLVKQGVVMWGIVQVKQGAVMLSEATAVLSAVGCCDGGVGFGHVSVR